MNDYQYIHDRLAERGLTMSDEQITALAAELEGLPTPEDLNDFIQIAKSKNLVIKTAKALAPKTTAKNQQNKERKTASQTNLNAALTHAAKQARLELETYESLIADGTEQWAQYKAGEMVNTVRSMSARTTEIFSDMIQTEVADLETFRTLGQEAFEILFPFGSATGSESK